MLYREQCLQIQRATIREDSGRCSEQTGFRGSDTLKQKEDEEMDAFLSPMKLINKPALKLALEIRENPHA